jgi:hypothetical protein
MILVVTSLRAYEQMRSEHRWQERLLYEKHPPLPYFYLLTVGFFRHSIGLMTIFYESKS